MREVNSKHFRMLTEEAAAAAAAVAMGFERDTSSTSTGRLLNNHNSSCSFKQCLAVGARFVHVAMSLNGQLVQLKDCIVCNVGNSQRPHTVPIQCDTLIKQIILHHIQSCEGCGWSWQTVTQKP